MNKLNFGLYKRTAVQWFLIISLLSSIGMPVRVDAQVDSTRISPDVQSVNSHADSLADIWDVYYRFINKKGHRSAERVESGIHPSIFPELAYALQTGFAIGANVNLSFTSNDPGQNISTIITTPQYTQYRQVIIPIVTNIWTKGNRYNIVSDWRYYHYSADNFGLGGYSPPDADDRLKYSYLRLHQAVLKQIFPDFSVGIGYALDYHWHISDTNLTPQLNDDFAQYNQMTSSVSSGLTFSMQYTNRRNSNNPQNGIFASLVVRPNMRWLGSDQNWQSVIADFRKYLPFPKNSRNILAFWSTAWLTLGGQAPYLDLPSTGWDTYSNMGRGYTQGRFRGQKLLYLETEYRVVLLNNGLLGGVVFANAQSYSDWPNNKFDKIIPGGGVGLRFKVNKHSNLNFACDYGFGIGGSHGLFLNLGEVF